MGINAFSEGINDVLENLDYLELKNIVQYHNLIVVLRANTFCQHKGKEGEILVIDKHCKKVLFYDIFLLINRII